MKLQKLSCPNCNGILDLNDDNIEYLDCPYCRQKFFVDDGKKEYTINKNINIKKDINKNITHTKRTYNEADVIRAKTEDREKKYSWVGWVGIVVVYLAIMVFCFWMADSEERDAKKAHEAGLISAGSYEDYKGEHYEAVVEQLEILGFENIKTVDLDDAGLAFWKSDKVESVSVGGDTSFYSSDYFEPDIAIIIKYH